MWTLPSPGFCAALAAISLLSGCQQYRWDEPVPAFLSFHRAVQRGERRVAFGALSSGTRTAYDAQAQALSERSGGGIRDGGMDLAFSQPASPDDITEVKLERQQGSSATLRITWNGHTQNVQMLKEGPDWKVDLTPDLSARSSGGAPTR